MRKIQKVVTKKPPNKIFQKFADYIIREIKDKYHGKKYTEKTRCPYCYSTNSYVHGLRDQLFCQLIGKNGIEKIMVKVARFKCKKCNKIFKAANAPFYKDCLYGKKIVDLCLTLSSFLSYYKTEQALFRRGIQIDRDTIRKYCKKFENKYTPLKESSYQNLTSTIIIYLLGRKKLEQFKKENKPQSKKKENDFFFNYGKALRTYKPNRYYTVKIPLPLYNAFDSFREQLNSDCTTSVVLSEVITELQNKNHEEKGLKEELKNILLYNPPPISDGTKRIAFRFINDDQFNYVKKLLYCPYAHNLSDFIHRVLSWYLREKGLLQPHNEEAYKRKERKNMRKSFGQSTVTDT